MIKVLRFCVKIKSYGIEKRTYIDTDLFEGS